MLPGRARVEGRAREVVEPRDEAAVMGVALDREPLGGRGLLVAGVADILAADRPREPGNVRQRMTTPENADQPVDEPGSQCADEIADHRFGRDGRARDVR
jgi:hypothetical protein